MKKLLVSGAGGFVGHYLLDALLKTNANIAQVCQMFDYQQYKKVPVVEQGKLVGVVNRGRLTRRSFEACLGTAE